MSNIIIAFDDNTRTLRISGSGNITWKDTVPYARDAEHVIIEGNEISSVNFSNMFARFDKLIDIEGIINTRDCLDMSYGYAGCVNLIKPMQLDTSSAEEFDFFHSDNKALTSVIFNSTEKGSKFLSMFYGCESLTQIDGVSIPSHIDLETVSDVKAVRDLLGTNYK